MCKQKTIAGQRSIGTLMQRKPSLHHQQGFSLLMVLAIMVIIALMVIAGSQVSNTELRISSNDADRKYAFSLAEKALLEGERYTVSKITNEATGKLKGDNEINALFSNEACREGLCKYADGSSSLKAAWERDDIFSGVDAADNSRKAKDISGGIRPPRYIVEYLGPSVEGRIFRVTSRAWGGNENTKVTLQSYVAANSAPDTAASDAAGKKD